MSKFTHTVTKEDAINKRPIRTLIRRHFDFSSRLRGKIKRENLVYLNGKAVAGWIIPSEGDLLEIRLPKERSFFEPEDIPINVIYEDEDLLIINKDSGIVVHPTYGYQNHTIANAVTKYMLDTGQEFKIRFINRIDMDTSGILILGKNSHAQDSYMKQQKKGNVNKIYTALVHGIIKDNKGIINAPIGKPDIAKPQRGVTLSGKPSVTEFKVVERFESAKIFDGENPLEKNLMHANKINSNKGYTLVKAKLITGRTHQIRVHFNHIGHTIVGDEFYGADDSTLIARQALHAGYLSFKHPVSGKLLEIEAPLAEDIQCLINKLNSLS